MAGIYLKCVAALGLGVLLLPAQYNSLTTTADGSRLYFAADARTGRIYLMDNTGVRLFASSSLYNLAVPQVSADGSVVAFTVVTGVETAASHIMALPGREETTVWGRVRLSPNGRYVLRYGLAGGEASLLDLQTGEDLPRPDIAAVVSLGRPLADSGAIVHGDSSVFLTDRAGTRTLTDESLERAAEAVIDAAARTVVYVGRWMAEPLAAFSRLRIVALPGSEPKTLIEGHGDFRQPILSDDGKRVLFLTNARFDGCETVGPWQAFAMETDGRGLRALTDGPEGVRLATLSGDGRVAFVVTNQGRLLRIDVDSGHTTGLLRTVIVT